MKSILFHGSPQDLKILRPQTLPSTGPEGAEITEIEEIHASKSLVIAAWHAVINSTNIARCHYDRSVRDGVMYFSVSERILAEARGKQGYVYLCDERDFRFDKKTKEWRADHEVRPQDRFVVTFESLIQTVVAIGAEIETTPE